jgi:hypothetical protein
MTVGEICLVEIENSPIPTAAVTVREESLVKKRCHAFFTLQALRNEERDMTHSSSCPGVVVGVARDRWRTVVSTSGISMILAAQGRLCRLCDMRASLDKKIYRTTVIEHRGTIDAQIGRSREGTVRA